MTTLKTVLVVGVLMLLFAGCSQEPAKIHYGSDECVHCKMMITDDQFAAQIVTDKGKAYKFDAIECMVAYDREHEEISEEPVRYVSNYNDGGSWLKADQAQFVKSEVVSSPMGASLLALPTDTEAEKHITEKPGKLMDWIEVSHLE